MQLLRYTQPPPEQGTSAAQAHTVYSPGPRRYFIHDKTCSRGMSCPSPKHELPAGWWLPVSDPFSQLPQNLKCLRFILEECLSCDGQTKRPQSEGLTSWWNMNLHLQFPTGLHGERQHRKHLKMQICFENDSVKMVSRPKFLLGLSDLMLFSKLKG